jgi:hypothetical protein
VNFSSFVFDAKTLSAKKAQNSNRGLENETTVLISVITEITDKNS